jgi:hypothetical protein
VFGVQSRATRTVTGGTEQHGLGATDVDADGSVDAAADWVGDAVGSVEAVSVGSAVGSSVGASVVVGSGDAVGAPGVLDGPDESPHAPTSTAITLTHAIQRQPLLNTSLAP